MAKTEVKNIRYDKITVKPDYRTDAEAEAYKTQGNNDPVIIAQPGLAEVGDQICVNNKFYRVVGTREDVSGLRLIFNNKEEPIKFSESNELIQNILRIPKDSTSNNYDINAYKPTSTNPIVKTQASDSEYGETPDKSICMGAGESGAKLEEGEIIKFAKFKTSLEFKNYFTESFNLDGTHSLYEYLASVMAKFYHQLYFIPNLKDNNVILAKPETLFVYPPSCNLILPNIKNSIAYTRSYKDEPTRLLLNTDPISVIGSGSGSPVTLNAVIFMEEEDTLQYKHGMRLFKHNPIALGTNKNVLTQVEQPMLNITNYERKNGIKTEIVNAGADIYAYLSAQAGGKSDYTYEDFNDHNVDQEKLKLATMSSDEKHIGKVMAGLAAYELCRQRFMRRQGSVQMYFNPYIIPGFPIVSVEGYTDGMTIFGYATHVAHELTDRSWTTTVSFTAAHTDDENCPRVFPVVEEEYTTGIDTTYKNMLGDNVVPLTNADLPALIQEYAQEQQFMTRSYDKIWRETTSLDDYLLHIADGATIMEDQNYTWFQNSEKSAFFNVELQAKLREYSNDIMNRHIAYHHDSVR